MRSRRRAQRIPEPDPRNRCLVPINPAPQPAHFRQGPPFQDCSRQLESPGYDYRGCDYVPTFSVDYAHGRFSPGSQGPYGPPPAHDRPLVHEYDHGRAGPWWDGDFNAPRGCEENRRGFGPDQWRVQEQFGGGQGHLWSSRPSYFRGSGPEGPEHDRAPLPPPYDGRPDWAYERHPDRPHLIRNDRPHPVRPNRPVVRPDRPAVRSDRPAVRSDRPVRPDRPAVRASPVSQGQRSDSIIRPLTNPSNLGLMAAGRLMETGNSCLKLSIKLAEKSNDKHPQIEHHSMISGSLPKVAQIPENQKEPLAAKEKVSSSSSTTTIVPPSEECPLDAVVVHTAAVTSGATSSSSSKPTYSDDVPVGGATSGATSSSSSKPTYSDNVLVGVATSGATSSSSSKPTYSDYVLGGGAKSATRAAGAAVMESAVVNTTTDVNNALRSPATLNSSGNKSKGRSVTAGSGLDSILHAYGGSSPDPEPCYSSKSHTSQKVPEQGLDDSPCSSVQEHSGSNKINTPILIKSPQTSQSRVLDNSVKAAESTCSENSKKNKKGVPRGDCNTGECKKSTSHNSSKENRISHLNKAHSHSSSRAGESPVEKIREEEPCPKRPKSLVESGPSVSTNPLSRVSERSFEKKKKEEPCPKRQHSLEERSHSYKTHSHSSPRASERYVEKNRNEEPCPKRQKSLDESGPSHANSLSRLSERSVERNKKEESCSKRHKSLEESGLLHPKFDKNFRIPKKAPLPNPLLSDASSVPTSSPPDASCSTWLQKPASKPSQKQAPKLVLTKISRNEDAIGEWRVRESAGKSVKQNTAANPVNNDAQNILEVLEGRVPVHMAEEVANARSTHTKVNHSVPSSSKKDSENRQATRKEDPRHSNKVDTTKKHKRSKHKSDKHGTRRSKKHDDERKGSQRKSRRDFPSRRREDSDEEWTPHGSRGRSRSRASTPASIDRSPVGVAGRTRSRTRSRSPHYSGFSAPISDDDDSSNVRDFISTGNGSMSPAARSNLSSCLQDMQLKKAYFLNRNNYVRVNQMNEDQDVDRDAVTPPLPISVSQEEDRTSTAQNISPPQLSLQLLPTERAIPPMLSPSTSTIITKTSISAPQPQNNPTSAYPQNDPNPAVSHSNHFLSGPATMTPNVLPPPSAVNLNIDVDDEDDISITCEFEIIDLEPQKESFKTVWNRLGGAVRNQIDIILDNLRVVWADINIYIEKFKLAEKLSALQSRIKEHKQLRENFISSVKKYYSSIHKAQSKIVPEEISVKKLISLLDHRWKINNSDHLITVMEGLEHLNALVNGATTREDLSPVSAASVAAGLFKIQNQKKSYLQDPPQTTHRKSGPVGACHMQDGTKLEPLPRLSSPVKKENISVEQLSGADSRQREGCASPSGLQIVQVFSCSPHDQDEVNGND